LKLRDLTNSKHEALWQQMYKDQLTKGGTYEKQEKE
jgi:hypothetical protein